MAHPFAELLRRNGNYRLVWSGQIVSDIGDHFNNIAVLAFAMQQASPGAAVSGLLMSRTFPAIVAGPFAGVVLDRFDRRAVMIASDLIRAVLALGFVLALHVKSFVLFCAFSALLMAASPFFSSGRASIAPVIVGQKDLHTASGIAQTTQSASTALGSLLAGFTIVRFGYDFAFIVNSLSFLFSAWCVWRVRAAREAFRPGTERGPELRTVRRDMWDGFRYLTGEPVLFGIVLLSAGWALGGGAAQVLFSLFGEIVFRRGPSGIGMIWSAAGLGLFCGGLLAHWLASRISFTTYLYTVGACFLLHGGLYVAFSQAHSFYIALVCILGSRLAVSTAFGLNFMQLLRNVSGEYRGRVFTTNETVIQATMLLSMLACGTASERYDPRGIAAVAGTLGMSVAIPWIAAAASGKLRLHRRG